MRRSPLAFAVLASLVLVGSSEARAQGPAQPAPWTSFNTTFTATGSDVWVRFFGASAGFTSQLFYFCGSTGCDQFLFQNNDVGISQPGDEVHVNQAFAVGEEVIFRLFVQSTGDNWFTGDIARNSDGAMHFATQVFNDVTANATYSVLGGFEDFPGGGDQDFNDLMFEFGGVQAVTATPEPASLALMGTGLFGLAGFSYRRRRVSRA